MSKTEPKSETYEELVNFSKDKEDTDLSKKDAVKRAFAFANNCRNKEIDRFWTRGLYFWGFIIASFGAYISAFKAFLANETNEEKVAISLSSILEMSFSAKIVLLVISFICFIFCLSWLLIHKGSKYWQENWETHIYHLEKYYMGEIYWTSLDTKDTNKFSANIFKIKPYNYSVTKISELCSFLLVACSFFLVIFHTVLVIISIFTSDIFSVFYNCIYLEIFLKILITLGFLIPEVIFMLYFCKNIKGNNDTEIKSSSYDKDYDYFCNKHKPDENISKIKKY